MADQNTSDDRIDFTTWQTKVDRYLHQFVSNKEDREDLTQEILIAFNEVAEGKLEPSYLYGVMRNMKNDWLKKVYKPSSQEVELTEEVVASNIKSFDDVAEERLQLDRVENAINELNEKEWQVIRHRFVGYSGEETANVLGIDRGHVYVLVKRALDRLRSILLVLLLVVALLFISMTPNNILNSTNYLPYAPTSSTTRAAGFSDTYVTPNSYEGYVRYFLIGNSYQNYDEPILITGREGMNKVVYYSADIADNVYSDPIDIPTGNKSMKPTINISSRSVHFNVEWELNQSSWVGGYDLSGNVWEWVNDNNISYPVDNLDRLMTITNTGDFTTHYTYDALNRLDEATDTNGYVSQYGYDEVGNIISHTDRSSHIILYNYDALDRLITNDRGFTTDYTIVPKDYWHMDAIDRHFGATIARGDVVEYRYITLGNVIEIENSHRQATDYTYDSFGHLLATTDLNSNLREWIQTQLNVFDSSISLFKREMANLFAQDFTRKTNNLFYFGRVTYGLIILLTISFIVSVKTYFVERGSQLNWAHRFVGS